jgi:tripartite-type tricarboxylate transporter receptor subunit TctC
MPKDIVARLSSQAVGIMKSAEVRQKLATSGAEPVGSTSVEMASWIANDYERWGDLIRKNGIKPEAQ